MKKMGILNKSLSEVIAGMGHTDQIVICDAGYPIPIDAFRIDLAVKLNLPHFFDVLDTVLEELIVEKVIIAEEAEVKSPLVKQNILSRFPNTAVEKIQHEAFKVTALKSKAYVRTGECTPYSNIILVAGVCF
jgi:D-ribose pyranase